MAGSVACVSEIKNESNQPISFIAEDGTTYQYSILKTIQPYTDVSDYFTCYDDPKQPLTKRDFVLNHGDILDVVKKYVNINHIEQNNYYVSKFKYVCNEKCKTIDISDKDIWNYHDWETVKLFGYDQTQHCFTTSDALLGTIPHASVTIDPSLSVHYTCQSKLTDYNVSVTNAGRKRYNFRFYMADMNVQDTCGRLNSSKYASDLYTLDSGATNKDVAIQSNGTSFVCLKVAVPNTLKDEVHLYKMTSQKCIFTIIDSATTSMRCQ